MHILPAAELLLNIDQRIQLANRLEIALTNSLNKVKKQEIQELLYQYIQQDIALLKEGICLIL